MSEINYDSLGRCTHLKAAISKASKERNLAINDLERTGSKSSEYDIERIKFVDVSKLRSAIDELEKADIELMSLIEEYNKYANSAGLKDIQLIKPVTY